MNGMLTNMYRTLTLHRLRWYALSTGHVLARHWKLFLLAGVFVPMGTPVLQLLIGLAYPLVMPLEVGHDLAWHWGHLAILQAIALIWILLQRRSIRGGDFMAYARALPIAASLRRWVDLSVLLPANSLLLVPVIALIVTAPSGRYGSLGFIEMPFVIATAVVVAAMVLMMQLAALEGRLEVFWIFGLADTLLSWCLSRPTDATSWWALGSVLVLSASILRIKQPGSTSTRGRFRRHIASWPPWHQHVRRLLSPAWRVQAQILFLQHPGTTSLRAAMALGIALAADGLYGAFAYDARTLPTTILAMAVIALIASGLYRTLRSAHQGMQTYLSALPLRRGFWARQDTACVVAFGTVPMIILLAPLFSHLGALFTTVLALALAYFGLLALLRFPVVHGGRQAILLAVILASTWSSAAMAAVIR